MRRLGIVAAANGLRHRLAGQGGERPFHAKLLLLVVVGIVIGGTAGMWVFPASALASDTCGQDVKFNTVASDGLGVAHDGIHVASPGMYIYNHDASCREISSIDALSLNSHGDQAEMGWIDIASGESNCNTIGDNTPYVMTVWVNMGTYHCFTHGSLTPNQSDAFSVWGDSSDNWTWGHSGNNVQLATLDFRTSESTTNGERHSTYDSAQSMFNGMQNGTTGHWNDWSNSVCVPQPDPDPDYFNQLHSATYISVSTSTQQC
jgi:hypothetical protein